LTQGNENRNSALQNLPLNVYTHAYTHFDVKLGLNSAASTIVYSTLSLKTFQLRLKTNILNVRKAVPSYFKPLLHALLPHAQRANKMQSSGLQPESSIKEITYMDFTRFL